MIDNKAIELIKKSQGLQNSRANFENKWQEVADVFRPIKATFTTQKSPGDKENIQQLYESMPLIAVSTLKSIIIGVFFNRSIKPISLNVNDEEVNEDHEVSEWLTDFTQMMLDSMFNPSSNFESSLSEAVADDITFGTIGTFIEKSSKGPLRYNTIPVSNFLIAESEEGEVDYTILKSVKTARQIIEKWGEKSEQGLATIHENITKAIEKNPFEEFNVELHILPRGKRERNRVDTLNKEIAGYWVDVKHKVIIEETGWDTMPMAIGRSEKASNEDYGTSRAMIALADNLQIQEMSKMINEATGLVMYPPCNVNADYDHRIDLRMRALNYPDKKATRSGQASIEPINIVGNISVNNDLIMRKEQNIREAFFLDKLKIFDNPNATATQVLELRAESFRIMGDFVTGLVGYMDKALNRTFSLLFSQIYDQELNLIEGNGVFNKPLPDLLKQNNKINVNYINPITQSQKLTESTTIDKWLQDIAGIAQFNPEILDIVNTDEVIRKKRAIMDIDPELINSPAKTANIRKARAEQQQQQQALEQEQQASQTAVNAKKAGML